MQALFDLTLKLIPIAIKSKELAEAATAVLLFLKENQHMVEFVLNWFDGIFGGPADDSDSPEGLDPIADKLQVLKAAM